MKGWGVIFFLIGTLLTFLFRFFSLGTAPDLDFELERYVKGGGVIFLNWNVTNVPFSFFFFRDGFWTWISDWRGNLKGGGLVFF